MDLISWIPAGAGMTAQYLLPLRPVSPVVLGTRYSKRVTVFLTSPEAIQGDFAEQVGGEAHEEVGLVGAIHHRALKDLDAQFAAQILEVGQRAEVDVGASDRSWGR